MKQHLDKIMRAFGDISIAREDLDYCAFVIKRDFNEIPLYSDEEILFRLRKVVSICDKVASSLESLKEENNEL